MQGVAATLNWDIHESTEEEFTEAKPIVLGGCKTETRQVVLGIGNRGAIVVHSDTEAGHIVRRDDSDCPDLGTVIYDDRCRDEVRVIGVGRIGLMAQFPPHCPKWVLLREVKTLGDVRRLAAAMGFESLQ